MQATLFRSSLAYERGGGQTETSTKTIERSQERRRYFCYSGWYGDITLKTSKKSGGGRRLLRPSTHTRSKYRQPLRSGGQTPKYRDTGQDTRGSMAPAASQPGRTAGDNRRYWGGRQINEKRTERRQEEEREMHAREICLETRSLGGGISGGGGERGGPESHGEHITLILNRDRA